MKFVYTASTKKGEIKEGEIEASSKENVVSKLKSKGLLLLSVEEEGKAKDLKHMEISFGGITNLNRLMFIKHLVVMIKSGLSLTESLEIAIDQTSSAKMKNVLKNVLERINNGQSFSDSLSFHKKYFSPIVINMIRAGEASGTLSENLEYLGVQLEKEYDLKKKIKGAMTYPIVVLVATFSLGIGLSIFILPKLVKLFKGLNIKLPVLTRIFLGLAEFLVSYGIFLLIGLVILIVLIRILTKWHKTKIFFHKIYLRTPIIKKLSQNTNLARFCRTLGSLLKSGLAINEALEISASVMGNVVFQNKIDEANQGIKKGNSLASQLALEEKLFPRIVSRMILVGEKSGRLEETLFYLAHFYEEEVDNQTKNLSTIIEPVLLVIIGLVIGFIGISIITPIYQISGSLSR